MRKQLGLATILLAISATLLWAHDLFLKLDSYFVAPNTALRVAVLNGTFATSEGAVTPDRLLDLSLVGPTQRRAIPRTAWKPSGDTTWLTVQTGAPGTYLIGAIFGKVVALDGVTIDRVSSSSTSGAGWHASATRSTSKLSCR